MSSLPAEADETERIDGDLRLFSSLGRIKLGGLWKPTGACTAPGKWFG